MVRELPVARLGRIGSSRVVTVLVRCESLLISSIVCLGSHGFAHPVKVDVRLVSFPLSGVQMAWLQTKIPRLTPCCPRRLPACVHRNCGERIPSWLRQLPQRFLKFGQAVDFRYGTLQRLQRGGDVIEEMFVTLDQAEKS